MVLKGNGAIVVLSSLLSEFWARVDRIVAAPAADLFTDDGAMLLGSLRCYGAESLTAYFAERNRTERERGRYTRHVLSNCWISGEGDGTYELRALILVFSGIGALPLPAEPPSTVADFVFDLRITDAGWRIARMVSAPIFLGANAPATSVNPDREEIRS